MELISNYLSKPVISIYEAEMIGTVISAAFDKKMKRVCYLLLVSDNDEEEIIYCVPINRIVTADNALTIKNIHPVKPYAEDNILVRCPINLPVYTTDGSLKGIIKDISFDSKTFAVSEIVLDNGVIPPDKIASVSNTMLIMKAEGFTKVQAPRARSTKKDGEKEELKQDTIFNIESEPIRFESIQFEDEEEYEDKEEEQFIPVHNPIRPYRDPYSAPARIISDYSFLLNRTVLADVYSIMGELIIPANTRITSNTVEIARKHGKLVELTVGSRLM